MLLLPSSPSVGAVGAHALGHARWVDQDECGLEEAVARAKVHLATRAVGGPSLAWPSGGSDMSRDTPARGGGR